MKRVTNHLKLACSRSPFFEHGYKSNNCPFHLIYKLDEDEEEYYLDCYDEMHNHALIPENLPYAPQKLLQAETPKFFGFE